MYHINTITKLTYLVRSKLLKAWKRFLFRVGTNLTGQTVNDRKVRTMISDEPRGDLNTATPTNQSHAQEPSIRVTKLQFSDGSKISIGNADVVVFVGPNNAGKSQALQDIQWQMSNSRSGIAIKDSKFDFVGSAEDLENYIKKHSVFDDSREHPIYRGYNYSISAKWMSHDWEESPSDFSPLFCFYMSTQTRLQGSDPVPAISSLKESANHPIHMLYQDDRLENRISAFFYRAFGSHLSVYRLGGKEIPLLVGQRVEPEGNEDRLSFSYNRRLLNATVSLQEQGDGMRSFASVVLHLLAPITPSILLLDEPEAFLHPPQARLLGEILVTERSNRAQLFVATHSADVLQGLLNVVDADHLRVIRIQREKDVNQVKELDRGRASEISKDPLMKYSSVLSGVFHRRVIICESDADCMFYNSLLDVPSVHCGPHPDALFIHANGKHRMAIQASALMALGVWVDAIVDIDILQSKDDLRKLFEALGGDWLRVKDDAVNIKKAIQQSGRQSSAGAVIENIKKVLAGIQPAAEFPDSAKQSINALLRDVSPWSLVKRSGESGIPAGQTVNSYTRLKSVLQSKGLWIVPVGELEGFCRNIGGHGPKWVQRVIAEYDLEKSEELHDARQFITQVWQSRVNSV